MNKLLYITCLALSSALLPAKGDPPGGEYVQSSILSTGRWFRIAVTADGIYRISYETLKNLGLENPTYPKLYSNNQGQLSYYNDNAGADDLKETTVWMDRGSDGVFNEGDYMLFYGQGTGRWKYNPAEDDFDYIKHNYSDTAFYFITSGTSPGKIMANAPVPSSAVNFQSNTSDALYIHEVDKENLIHSGREWFEPVTAAKDAVLDPDFANIVTGEPVKFEVRVAARASGQTSFTLSENGSGLSEVSLNGVDLSSNTGTYATIGSFAGTALPSGEAPVYGLRFMNNGEASARGWLDFARFHSRKRNLFGGGTMFLTDSRASAPGRITEFSVTSTVAGVTIWDITDPCNNEIIQYNKSGDNIIFRSSTDSIRSFVVFAAKDALSPVIVKEQVASQDLHSSGPADMIIVAHPLFMRYATRLAEFHLSRDGITSTVVTPRQIYNEFSGGTPDIAAIRNFVRMKYLKQKGTSRPLKYLLLFGDGSYENRTPPPRNTSFIPTYQSLNSNVYISSFTSDDFFGLLDDGEGEETGTEDIGIGRIPAADTSEASLALSKIEGYLGDANNGPWKDHVCIVADDEDNNEHMINAEGLSSLLADSVPWINTDKIYFDAFNQVTTSTGQFYPDVTRAINDRINSGALIFNYTGHGNESSLGHERVVTMETIDQWANGLKLPLFITATCEFSRFDDVTTDNLSGIMTGKNSAGERILLSGKGGGIALMSTTRLVYSAPNYTLNRNILDAAFNRDGNGRALCLGDIIRIAKNRTSGTSNKRNFLLLGDPAIRLSYPWHGMVVTDSVIDAITGRPCDTLKALAMIDVFGHIQDMAGNPVTDFSGTVLPVVNGKPVKVTTLANDGGPAMDFLISGNTIFSGKCTAAGGNFSFRFMVPRDIDYNFGRGRISYYAYDGDSDMDGNYDSLIIGGFSNTHASDTSGPEIRLFLNDTLFRDGGISDSNPKLFAMVSDPGGINAAGMAIGHDMVCWVDGDRDNPFILNNYFTYDQGTFSRGAVTYLLQNLSEGYHTVTLKAWDNFNNSSEKAIGFTVSAKDGLIVRNPVNFPNPFTNSTGITFEHNRPGEELEITIEIFNLQGDLIRVLRSSEVSSGYRLSPVTWDGSDLNGRRVAKGIYPYRVRIRANNTVTAYVSGRMIIL